MFISGQPKYNIWLALLGYPLLKIMFFLMNETNITVDFAIKKLFKVRVIAMSKISIENIIVL
jgi:hypothetical protein